MGKVIAFSNQKGGVGKTTTCVNVSTYLASFGKKVLMLDMDAQGNATTGLGFDKSNLDQSVYDVLINSTPIKDIAIKTDIDNLYLVPSNIDLAGAEVELVSINNREQRLKIAIDEIIDDYDYITIDCPPSLGLTTINTLIASHSIIITIQSEYYALEGLTQLLNTIKLVSSINKNLKIEGIVLTMYDNRAIVSREISTEIRKHFGKKVFDTVIPRNIRLSEAPSHGVPVLLHDPKCSGAKAYEQLTKELLQREEQNENK